MTNKSFINDLAFQALTEAASDKNLIFYEIFAQKILDHVVSEITQELLHADSIPKETRDQLDALIREIFA